MPSSDDYQTLAIAALRLHASIGVLPHEINQPQPIEASVQLCVRAMPLLCTPQSVQEAMHGVLDYRKVRQTIIDTCTAGHVYLLETLVGTLCARLLQLRGVRGVRVKISKLEVFGDCTVSITREAGEWWCA